MAKRETIRLNATLKQRVRLHSDRQYSSSMKPKAIAAAISQTPQEPHPGSTIPVMPVPKVMKSGMNAVIQSRNL